MNFEKYICWNPNEITSIIRTEAEASEDAVFLAVHADNKINVSIHKAKSKALKYSTFLDKFIHEDYGNNVLAVIEGESGSGKSHLIQWLRLHIPVSDNRILLTIPKTETNLYSILKKLISYLPNSEQDKYVEKLKRTETGLTNDKERINEFLSSLARTIERDVPTSADEKGLIPLIPKLFDDPYFRDTFFNDHPVINNIISLIFSNSSIVRNNESRQEFKKEHLPLNSKEALKASESTQEVLEAILDEEWLLITLDIINRNLDKAITRTLSFSPDDLIELMTEIRKYLYKDQKELILLIEDFVQLQGVDTALLHVLTAEGTGELCKIKWAMAVTTGYFEKLEDTVRERMTFKIDMDNPWDQKNIVSQNHYILQLGSKYLNAIRLGHTNIINWYKRYQADNTPVSNQCDNCVHKKICHNTFGQIDGIGLYPFNETAILKMAREADKQKHNVFRPRVFINSVLKRNLNKEMVDTIENGQYPPRDLYEDFNTEQLAFDEVNKLTKLDPLNHDRRETLLELWSTTSVLSNLDEAIHKAFALPLLNDIDPVVQPLPDPKEPIPTPPVTETKIDDHIKSIEQWGRGKDLHHSTASRLRPFIFNAIVNYIDWSFVSVAKSMNILKQANIYFVSDNSRRPTSGFVLDIEQNTDMAIILKTFYTMNKDKDVPVKLDSFVQLQEQVRTWSQYLVMEIEKEYAPKENWDPSIAAIELLTLGNIAAAEKATINSLFIKNIDYGNLASSSFRTLISKITSISDREKLFQDILEKTYTGKKGGSKTSAFIDVQKVLPAISQLRKDNWRLMQDPSLETRKEFKDLALKYEKWQLDFESSLMEELIERFKWLDELTNRILVEDIGIKFKNQVKNLRDLTSELGLPGYKSAQLDNALLCNFAQAKTALETTSRLQESSKNEIFKDLFPSRKDDAEQFIKLITLYEEMLATISIELKSRTDELNRRTGLSSINLEIENSMHSIKQSFETLKGEEHAS